MMVRLLAYCLNFDEQLEFCKGLSDTEEPDLWARALTGEIDLWIEVGEPAADRIKKSSRQARKTIVYCFNTKSSTWWQLESPKIAKLPATIIQFSWPEVKKLASLVERTMDISVTVTGDSIYVATARGEVDLSLTTLQE